MNEQEIINYIIQTFPEVETQENFGYTFFFYQSERVMPFATLITADNEYDTISNLNRPGVYRLNIGISRATFQALFGSQKIDPSQYNFTACDVLMPHPDYAPQNFVCVLSPGAAILEQVKQLLAEAYEIAVTRFNRRNKSTD